MSEDVKSIIQMISWIAGSAGLLVGGLSAFLAYKVLKRNIVSFRADHDRSRKAEALKLILLWNENALKHRRAIEKRFNNLLDITNDFRTQAYLDKGEARKIYLSKPDEEDWELRFHLLELFNFFEAVSVAYLHGVADSELVEASFKSTLLHYNKALRPFVEFVEESRNYDPWKPFTELLGIWEPAPRRNITTPEENAESGKGPEMPARRRRSELV
jgi:hypothetical protein